jgi:ferritin-like metal-binding protein YciE
MPKNPQAEALAESIDDAYAMERRSLHTLDSIIATTDDGYVRSGFERHRGETERHAERLLRRLEALGRTPSVGKEAQGLVGATVEAFVDELRSDSARRNVSDLYGAEHSEIATYELLERLADRLGDDETAQVARENRRDEEAMTQVLAANWSVFLDLALAERR